MVRGVLKGPATPDPPGELEIMSRKLAALLPFVAAVLGTTHASAIPLDPYGTGEKTTDWNAPKVAPRTHCVSLMLYLADAPADQKALRKYRFTGTCTFNTAPQGRVARMKTVEVLVDAEYHPGMKRASERIVVQDPEFAVSFSTWATCPLDPFSTYAVVCGNKGMGANKFDKYISVDDVPFANNRATKAQVDGAVATFKKAQTLGAPANSFWQNPEIAGFNPIGKSNAGTDAYIQLNIKGGAGMCPTVIDYGDGTKPEVAILWGNLEPFKYQFTHKFEKPGFYKVTARSRPGCTGEHLAYALVK